jgi:hypothetical protein
MARLGEAFRDSDLLYLPDLADWRDRRPLPQVDRSRMRASLPDNGETREAIR